MNKKSFIYFAAALLIIGSMSAYFISKDMTKNDVVITGEYDIWESQADTQSEITEILMSESEITTENSSVETQLLVNINTASSDDLMKLSGIGTATAEKIIDYRTTNGDFSNIEELMDVKGIGEKTFSKIKNHIYVENPVYPN